jgi:hypothetical protein
MSSFAFRIFHDFKVLRIESVNPFVVRPVVEGTLSTSCMGSFPFDHHDGGNVNKLRPPNGPLLSNLGGPHATNRVPGEPGKFPCWTPQWGRPKPEQCNPNCALHWHQNSGTIEPGLNFMLKAFDMRSQSLFPAHKPVPRLERVRHT